MSDVDHRRFSEVRSEIYFRFVAQLPVPSLQVLLELGSTTKRVGIFLGHNERLSVVHFSKAQFPVAQDPQDPFVEDVLGPKVDKPDKQGKVQADWRQDEVTFSDDE